MSATTDAKTISVNMLKSSYRLMSKDLEHLPDAAFCQSFGPACRTVSDIIYELNMVNDSVGREIRGEEMLPWPENWIKAPGDFRAKDTVIAAFTASIERFVSTVQGFSEEEMLVPISDGEGGETNRFERCRFVALHNWYHSGQLNFIQTLLGDDAFHW